MAGDVLGVLDRLEIPADQVLLLTRIARVGVGLAYGWAWWFLGPLTLMPLFMGMGLGVNWNVAAAGAMLPSLVGHLMYGGVLGVVYIWLRHRDVGLVLATAG